MRPGSPSCERAGRKADGGRRGGPAADYWSTTWHVEDRPETRIDPKGPRFGDARVIRGGSYLCHHSYCNRYRVAVRAWNTEQRHWQHRFALRRWRPVDRPWATVRP